MRHRASFSEVEFPRYGIHEPNAIGREREREREDIRAECDRERERDGIYHPNERERDGMYGPNARERERERGRRHIRLVYPVSLCLE